MMVELIIVRLTRPDPVLVLDLEGSDKAPGESIRSSLGTSTPARIPFNRD